MRAGAVALPPSSDVEPRTPPPWWPVIWATFVGYLLALVAGFVVWIGLLLAGVVHSGGTFGAYPETFLEWPYLSNGVWSTVANVTFAAAGLALAAWAVRRSVRERTGRHTSFVAVFAALAVTGYAPLVAYPGLLPFNGVLALVSTAALVRWFALEDDALRPRERRRAAVAGASAAVAGLLAASAYGVFHPLWFEAAVSASGRETTLAGDRVVVYRSADTRLVTYEFSLENAGFADVVVTGVERRDRRGLISVVTVHGGTEPAFVPPARLSAERPPLEQLRIPGRATRFLTLVLRIRGCRLADGTDVVERLRVRYRVLGVERVAPVPLVPAPSVRCS